VAGQLSIEYRTNKHPWVRLVQTAYMPPYRPRSVKSQTTPAAETEAVQESVPSQSGTFLKTRDREACSRAVADRWHGRARDASEQWAHQLPRPKTTHRRGYAAAGDYAIEMLQQKT
jgi:hypothetical protein